MDLREKTVWIPFQSNWNLVPFFYSVESPFSYVAFSPNLSVRASRVQPTTAGIYCKAGASGVRFIAGESKPLYAFFVFLLQSFLFADVETQITAVQLWVISDHSSEKRGRRENNTAAVQVRAELVLTCTVLRRSVVECSWFVRLFVCFVFPGVVFVPSRIETKF